MSDPYLCGKIPKIEARIDALEEAMLDISSDGIVRYSFDSGQTNQSVEKMSLKDAQAVLDSLYTRRDTLRQRCGLDSSSFNAGPAY